MSKNGGGSSSGVLIAITVAALLIGIFGGGLSAVLGVLGIAFGAIVLLVAAVMFFAFKGSAEDAKNAAKNGRACY